MITVHWARLNRAFAADSDFDFLRLRLDGAADARAVLEAWQPRAQEVFARQAWIGVPVALDERIWAVDLEGAENTEDLAAIVTDLVATLEAAGFSGEIGPQPLTYSPLDDPLSEFALTAVGGSLVLRREARETVVSRGHYTREDVDRDALAAVLERAVAWCTALGGRSHVGIDVLSLETTGRDVLPLLRAALRHPSRSATLTVSRWPEEARRVTVTRTGHVLVYFGGPAGTWAAPGDTVRRVEDLLAHLAPWLDYGCARQIGEAPVAYEQLYRIYWPAPAGFQPPTLHWLRGLEGIRILEAYGMHLLGPGHDLRALSLGAYLRKPAPAGRVILAHRDLDRWFGASPYPPTDLRDRARQELAPLLFGEDECEAEEERVRAGSRPQLS